MNWKNEMDFSSVIAPHLTLSSLENDYQKTMTKKQCMVVIPAPQKNIYNNNKKFFQFAIK